MVVFSRRSRLDRLYTALGGLHPTPSRERRIRDGATLDSPSSLSDAELGSREDGPVGFEVWAYKLNRIGDSGSLGGRIAQ